MTATFETEQPYDVSRQECLDFMSDPGLQQHLAGLEGLSHRKVTGFRRRGNLMSWEVEVAMGEQLPAFLRGMLRPEQMRWLQKFEMDLDRLEFTYRIEHGLPANTLEVHGVGRLISYGPDRSAIAISGQVTCGFPLIGRRVEAFVAKRTREMVDLDGQRRRGYIESHRGQAQPIQLDEDGNPADPRIRDHAPGA